MNLTVNRRLTKAFIDQNPVEIVMTPRHRERTAAGGFQWVDHRPRSPQVMTLIETGGVGGIPRPTITQDGIDRVIEFQLLAEHDARMERYDVFEHDGKEWEVVELYHDNGYERRANVTRRG